MYHPNKKNKIQEKKQKNRTEKTKQNEIKNKISNYKPHYNSHGKSDYKNTVVYVSDMPNIAGNGQGVFAKENISKPTKVGSYVGVLISQAEYIENYKDEKSQYIFRISADLLVDADPERIKGLYIKNANNVMVKPIMHLINGLSAFQRQEMNLETNCKFVVDRKSKSVSVQTTKPVYSHQELILPYGKNFIINTEINPQAQYGYNTTTKRHVKYGWQILSNAKHNNRPKSKKIKLKSKKLKLKSKKLKSKVIGQTMEQASLITIRCNHCKETFTKNLLFIHVKQCKPLLLIKKKMCQQS